MGGLSPITPVSGDSGAPGIQPSLTPQRWQKIKELFSLALERAPEQRASLLDQVCEADHALRSEVESLLASAESEQAVTRQVFKSVSTQPSSPAVGAAEDPMIGRRVGDYRIERRIGYGGMAAVYLASRADEQFQMLAAIKVLRPDLDRVELLRRFFNERQTLAALDHPHVVKLLDGGSTEEGLPYLVMDYVEGIPIDEYCDTHALSIHDRLQLFCTVCEAVSYAHRHNVVHRDLKPNNILVTVESIPKLLDFGISKVLDPLRQSGTTVTRTATRHLTPAYASPEQIRGEGASAATDVYSLGVVLYELLTGHRPYRLQQRTPGAVERAICEQEPESPSTAVDRIESETRADGTVVTVNAETVSRTREGQPAKLRHSLKGDLDNIVLTALQKDPTRRYESVAEFTRDIRRHLEHQPVRARPNTLAYRASRFARRHRTDVMVGVIGTLVSLGAIGYSVWVRQSTAERNSAAVRSQSAGRHSVAILGFKNASGHPDRAWLSTALSEILATELAAGGKLRLIPGDEVARTKRDLGISETDSLSKRTLQAVRNNLGADFIVLGSYLDTSDDKHLVRYELRAQNAALGETIASTVETDSETALADLAARFGADLRAKLGVSKLSPADSASLRASMPSNPEAIRYYAEGLSKLRIFEPTTSRELLEKAVAADPGFALAHSALAESWAELGYDENAKKESARALDLSASLAREDRLVIEARAHEAEHEWKRAAEIYTALFEFFPDNIEYGLKLVEVRAHANMYKEALATIDSLHKLPPPLGVDPRIDLLEARFAYNDTNREEAALRRALQKTSASGAVGLLAQAKMEEANWYKLTGDMPKALAPIEEAQELFEKIGDRNGALEAASWSADFAFFRGDWETARRMYEKVLALYRATGNRSAQAQTLSDLGYVLAYDGDWGPSEKMFLESLTIARQLQDKRMLADILNNFGATMKWKGDLPSSNEMFQEALDIYRGNADPRGMTLELNHVGAILYAQGNLAEAEKACLQAIQASLGKKDLYFTANVYPMLGKIRIAQGKLEQARKDQERGAEIRGKTGQVEAEAQSKLNLAALAIETGQFEEATQLATDAEGKFQQGRGRDFTNYARVLQAESLLGRGRFEDAQQLVTRALSGSEKFVDVDVHLSIEIAAARVSAASAHYANRGVIAEADALLNAALSDAKTHGYLGHQFDARLGLAELKMKSGRVAEGSKELTVLEHDARAKGFMLVARKAARARE
jgi:serine/threonine protein kinase/tetratricopeptide (TPR) repeat protein